MQPFDRLVATRRFTTAGKDLAPVDNFQTRAIEHIRKRNEAMITEQAERIQEHIGYVLQRIEAGRADSTGMYAADIEASARRILLSVAVLETLGETTKILETSDEPAKESKT